MERIIKQQTSSRSKASVLQNKADKIENTCAYEVFLKLIQKSGNWSDSVFNSALDVEDTFARDAFLHLISKTGSIVWQDSTYQCASQIDSQIQIRLYDDRLEIWNSGSLIQPLKQADLFHQHLSIPRNPLIAEAFFNTNLIEKWGTGTLRMIELMRSVKLEDPIFDTDNTDRFRLVFMKDASLIKNSELDLNERQTQALLLCRKKGHLTNLIYQEAFRVSKRTASVELKDLMAKGLLTKHGTTGKGTRYEITPMKGQRGN